MSLIERDVRQPMSVEATGKMAAYGGKVKALIFAFPMEVYTAAIGDSVPGLPGFAMTRVDKNNWEIRVSHVLGSPKGRILPSHKTWILSFGATEFLKTDGPFPSTRAEYRCEGSVIYVGRAEAPIIVKQRRPKKLVHWEEKSPVSKSLQEMLKIIWMVKAVEDTTPYRLMHNEAGFPVWRAPDISAEE